MTIEPNNPKNCANAIVKMLENHGVTHVFGIPGAKIDSLFIALKHSKIRLILCQHEQNAAFMAAAFGRLTGKVGVCIATSGPGVTNLTTGLATATSEGDPVLAIGGEVPVDERLKKTHQSLDSTALMKAATKLSEEIVTPDQVGEALGNAIRVAESGRPGAVFLSLPKDVGLADYPGDVNANWGKKLPMGPAAKSAINDALSILKSSKRPIAILGMQSSGQDSSEGLINFFKKSGIPYVSTFQGAGAWVSESSGATYAGRIGLFRNQPADNLLDQADVILTIGYDPIEYDPSIWNTNLKRPVICLDAIPADQDNAFLPIAELIGDIGESLDVLSAQITTQIDPAFIASAKAAVKEIQDTLDEGKLMNKFPVEPLRLVHELQKQMTSNTHVALDVGSNYIWTNRYCAADHSRQVLVSNGQQTLGVAMPWAIAMSLLYPNDRILSSSGDGGFLFTGTELATAVRIGAKFVHVIWDSGSFDMVAFQEQAHYGETAGIKLGSYDPVKFAESFGCKGYSVKSADELPDIFEEAFKSDVPVLIHVPVDYSLNERLMQNVSQNFIN
ncbi:acetolactate synthase AlsS [Polynucleobacter sp. JS-Safj-400b-B2]|uniref:acetolactate synthase AlsS n=1 Tax=Polynucleobacter sp. JS-Safj-400b-B2 TaxID=2576921 RepID=UPI001C0C76C8|nr:acetolactate synthase AlsS [Polynucleobacter sp. JS-Safj-400b-B2]MBU3627278.1 acetolactate synthase AlsS [Polynucleobacter sp. JS-Safj-400b-B2]